MINDILDHKWNQWKFCWLLSCHSHKKTKRKPTLIPRQTVSPTVSGTKKVSFLYKNFISTNPLPKAFMASRKKHFWKVIWSEVIHKSNNYYTPQNNMQQKKISSYTLLRILLTPTRIFTGGCTHSKIFHERHLTIFFYFISDLLLSGNTWKIETYHRCQTVSRFH